MDTYMDTWRRLFSGIIFQKRLPTELIDSVRGYLWSPQKEPDLLEAYFAESSCTLRS
jgi:hypothetical protein